MFIANNYKQAKALLIGWINCDILDDGIQQQHKEQAAPDSAL